MEYALLFIAAGAMYLLWKTTRVQEDAFFNEPVGSFGHPDKTQHLKGRKGGKAKSSKKSTQSKIGSKAGKGTKKRGKIMKAKDIAGSTENEQFYSGA